MKQSLKTQDGTRPIQQSLWAGSRNGLVNRTALRENDKAKMMIATSGLKCLESFEKFNRPGLLAKTFPALLIGQKGWYSKKCNLIWKLKATRYNRLYFQLQVSVPRTEEIGSGLLPTPLCMDTNCGDLEKIDLRREKAKAKNINGNGFGMTVGELANRGLLPTPRANKVNGCNLNSENLASRGKGNLEETVAQWVVGMLPTPTADDCPSKNTGKRNQDGLQKRAFQTTGKTSQLNHRFVMEMMGFPPDWCDIYYELAEIAIQKKRQKKKPKG